MEASKRSVARAGAPLVLVGLVASLAGCSSGALTAEDSGRPPAARSASPVRAEQLYVIDCLLPAQIRKLGRAMTYLGSRRAVKTSAVECEIRGGEYVAYDRADYATALRVWLPLAQEGDKAAQAY